MEHKNRNPKYANQKVICINHSKFKDSDYYSKIKKDSIYKALSQLDTYSSLAIYNYLMVQADSKGQFNWQLSPADIARICNGNLTSRAIRDGIQKLIEKGFLIPLDKEQSTFYFFNVEGKYLGSVLPNIDSTTEKSDTNLGKNRHKVRKCTSEKDNQKRLSINIEQANSSSDDYAYASSSDEFRKRQLRFDAKELTEVNRLWNEKKISDDDFDWYYEQIT